MAEDQAEGVVRRVTIEEGRVFGIVGEEYEDGEDITDVLCRVEAWDQEIPRYPPVPGYNNPFIPDIQQWTLGTRAKIPSGYMVNTLRTQTTCVYNMPSDQMLNTFRMCSAMCPQYAQWPNVEYILNVHGHVSPMYPVVTELGTF